MGFDPCNLPTPFEIRWEPIFNLIDLIVTRLNPLVKCLELLSDDCTALGFLNFLSNFNNLHLLIELYEVF